MIDIKTLPDLFERRFYKIELVGGSKPSFEAGEMVDLLWNSTLGERTIRKISGDPSGVPWPIFMDTARRDVIGDVLASGGTSVIEGVGVELVTDWFVDAAIGYTEYALLTVEDGYWKEAASGKTVFGRLLEVPSATKANDGRAKIRIVSHYVLP